MLMPMNTEEIPKSNKDKPTIVEIKLSKNIGNIMQINPKIIISIPKPLLMFMIVTSVKLS